jgi:DNA helicase MCM8
MMYRLNGDAKKTLEEFYLKLRKEHQSADGTPITTRQVNSTTIVTIMIVLCSVW